MSLDNSQQRAVDHAGGPLLVLAGPGSGKTRVLCHRIAALAEGGVPTGRILAVTFTRKAAIEMAERLHAMMAYPPLWVMTFHRLCARILRQSGSAIGLEPGWSIADTTKSRAVTRRAIEDLRLKLEDWPPAEEHGKISLRKNREIDPADDAIEDGGFKSNDARKVSLRIHRRYLRIMADEHLLDFDDLLINTVRVLNCRNERDRWAGHWDHVLVDEFQDTNRPQYRIMSALSEHRQVTAVGDPDQAIYGWRGAERRNLDQFRKDYNPAVVELGLNYRSTPNIVTAARRLLENPNARAEGGGERADRDLRSTRDRGMPVTVVVHRNDKSEAVWIHNLAVEEINKGGSAADNRLGVLYRVNSLSRPIEERLIRSSIPYTISGGARFYDRKEIQDALAYLHVINNEADDEAFERIINRPPRGLGKESLKKIRQADVTTAANAASHAPLFATEDQINELPARNTLLDRTRLAATTGLLSAKQAERALHLVEVIEVCRLRASQDGATAQDILETVLFSSGYIPHLTESKKAEDHDRLDNLDQLIAAAREYSARGGDADEPGSRDATGGPAADAAGTLQGFLDEAALMTDREAVDDSSARVHLMTMHAAKGLEFPTVVIAGVEAHLCPLKPRHDEHRMSTEQAHEERRLFYVGMTRAKEELYLSQALKRTRFGRSDDTVESPYIADLPLQDINYSEMDAALAPVPRDAIAKTHAEPRDRRGKPRPRDRPRTGASRPASAAPPPPEAPPEEFWNNQEGTPGDDYNDMGLWEDGELYPADDDAPRQEASQPPLDTPTANRAHPEERGPAAQPEPMPPAPQTDAGATGRDSERTTRPQLSENAGANVFGEILDYSKIKG